MEKDIWCDCKGEETQAKCHELASYRDDWECECGVEKHHWHGGVCGKIVQIG